MSNSENEIEQPEDENNLIAQRRQKLSAWRSQGQAYPTHIKRDILAQEMLDQYNAESHDDLEAKKIVVHVAGRIMTRRMMGKASFTHIQDSSGKVQLYIRQDLLGNEEYAAFCDWDLGDVIAAEGHVFKTKTGELSIKVEKLILLAKALRPLPDKFHGLHDQETRYRQRYLDLIANADTRRTFMMRSQITAIVRQFLQARGFLEVETPMMQVMAGGAAAKPFITHHEALDMNLFLRIAPELYLKRLIVGGFEKVFELNRNFRNEGLSTQHNPEFTMLEFYQAYADYHELMQLTEALFLQIATEVLGTAEVTYQDHQFDFSQAFTRLTLRDAILKYNPTMQLADLSNSDLLRQKITEVGGNHEKQDGLGKLQVTLFEKTVEHLLIQPTFITEYPAESSPLARKNDHDAFVTDRFELFIAGREIANGFNELNDPEDQAERFAMQMQSKADGDQEAMPYDEDYITALEYGMPPTAGEGIGIDRLVMLFANAPSIRDVLLFPHMRHK